MTMKIRNKLICGTLAAVMLLGGCKENTTSGGSYVAPGDVTDSASNGGANSTAGYTIESVKPKEIEGFRGNLEDVAPKSGDLIATFEIEGYGTIKAVLFPEAAPVGVENFQKLCDAGFYKGLKIHRVVKDFMFQGGSTNGNGTGGDALVNGGKFSIETAQNARHFYGALCYANAGAENNSTQFYIVNNKAPQDLATAIPADNLTAQVAANLKELNDNASTVDKETADAYYAQYVKYYQNMADFAKYASDSITARYKEKGGTPSLDGNYTVFGQVYEGFDVIDTLSAAEVTDNGSGEKSKPVKDIIIKNVTVSTFE